MKSLKLTAIEIADLCRELGLLLHAGVQTGDGLRLLAEEELRKDHRQMLTQMAESVELGAFLSEAFTQAGCFPGYITGLLQVGEQVGRTEETLNALSAYYEQQDRMAKHIRSALTYPIILLLLMLGVIVVLLSQVLPVFNEIYASLGGRLTGLAGGLLLLGQFLDRAMPLLCGILAVGLVLFGALALHQGFRDRVLGLWNKHFGDRGIARKLNNAHFAQALSMGVSSGLTPEESVEMAGLLLQEIPGAAARCKRCRELLDEGLSLAEALGQAELMASGQCRLLTLGLRSGSGDKVMEEIAGRMQEDAALELESMVGKIEPALVLVTSALVGMILLSVMLPLMNIMTVIG